MDKPAHFVIVGGGTAGWITAFILQDSIRRLKLDAKVSVVESSKIPTVGVGEATTAAFHVFLKHFGIDIVDFMRTLRGDLQARHPARGLAAQGLHLLRADRRSAPGGEGAAGRAVATISTSMRCRSESRCRTCTSSGRCCERKKAPWALKADGSLLRARAVPAGLSLRPGAGRASTSRRKSQGVEIVDNVLTGRRARRRERRRHRARLRGRAAARGRLLHRCDGVPQAADRRRAQGAVDQLPARAAGQPRPALLAADRGGRGDRQLHPRLGAGSGLDVADPDAVPLRLRLRLFRRVPHARTRRMPRSSGCWGARSRCAATSSSRSGGSRRRGSATCVAVGLSSSFLEPLEVDLDPRHDRADDDVRRPVPARPQAR